MLREIERIPQQKMRSFLRTLVGGPIVLEFQEDEGNRIVVEIPGILERRYVAGHEGHYIKGTDIQVIASEIDGIFHYKQNERPSTGIILSQRAHHMLNCKNGRLYI
ncbi:MAG: hypothetical protein AABY03_00975 [Nanoarchaeota archaeon]